MCVHECNIIFFNMYMLLYCTNKKEVVRHETKITKATFKIIPFCGYNIKKIVYRVAPPRKKDIT